MNQRGLHTCIPPDVRLLHARLNTARRHYRFACFKRVPHKERDAIKAECARLVEQLKALKCR